MTCFNPTATGIIQLIIHTVRVTPRQKAPSIIETQVGLRPQDGRFVWCFTIIHRSETTRTLGRAALGSSTAAIAFLSSARNGNRRRRSPPQHQLLYRARLIPHSVVAWSHLIVSRRSGLGHESRDEFVSAVQSSSSSSSMCPPCRLFSVRRSTDTRIVSLTDKTLYRDCILHSE